MSLKNFLFLIILFTLVLCFGFTKISNAEAGSVVISELAWMGGVESANDEWIELENKTEAEVDLTGWRLVALDGSPDILLTGTISAQGFFLLERSDDNSVPTKTADFIYSGSLGNDGETLQLFNDDDNLIDEIVSPDAWDAGNNETKETMQLSGADWITAVPTPRDKNQEISVTNDEQESKPVIDNDTSSGSGVVIKKVEKIIINEIYPNPVGSDRHKEFVEIYNAGNVSVDLSGWSLEVNDKRYVFGMLDDLFEIKRNIIIQPGAYLALFRDFSKLVLNNQAGTVKLFKPGKKAAEQSIDYQDAPEGYALVNSAEINLSEVATSTKKFFFNSPLVGEWVWSSLISPGANNQIKALNTAPRAVFSVPDKIVTKQEIFFDSSDTVDEEGDSLDYVWNFDDGVEISLPEARHTFLNPGDYQVTLRVNDGKAESLFSKMIKVVPANVSDDFIDYENEDSEYYSWYEDLENISYPLLDYNNYDVVKVNLLSLDDLKNYPIDIDVKTKGTVTVVPGVLATQSFYITDNNSGFKVYNYKKDFPELAEGDVVEVEGSLSVLKGETVLKIENKESIAILDSGIVVSPIKGNSDDVVGINLGSLLEIEGEVVSKKMPRVYLADDFGEVVVYLKSGVKISNDNFKEGARLRIAGIVGLVAEQVVLFPRGETDVFLVEIVDSGEVLGEVELVSEWSLEEGSKNVNLIKYFIVILIALVIFVLIYIYRKRG